MGTDPDKTPDQTGHSLVVEEAKPRLKKPPLFHVFLVNDDFTPMEFVVDVLERVFGHDRQNATRVMLEVHTRGKGTCGVYTFEIAETKVAQVTSYARQHQLTSMAEDWYLHEHCTEYLQFADRVRVRVPG